MAAKSYPHKDLITKILGDHLSFSTIAKIGYIYGCTIWHSICAGEKKGGDDYRPIFQKSVSKKGLLPESNSIKAYLTFPPSNC